MKKLMTIAFAALAAATAIAATRNAATIRSDFAALKTADERIAYAKTLTEAEWRAFADDVIAEAQSAENPSNIYAYADSKILYYIGNPWPQSVAKAPAALALAAEYDAKFAAAGFSTHPYRYSMLPLCCDNYWATPAGAKLAAECPAYSAQLRKYRATRLWDVADPAECINYLAEHMARGIVVYGPQAKNKKDAILRNGAKLVRRRIRSTGGSWVAGAPGAVRMKAALDELAQILDSPRMAGLAAWMATWAPSYQWQEPAWMTSAEVDTLTAKVLDGDENITASVALRLCATMGVAAYNAFVRTYNGTGAQ